MCQRYLYVLRKAAIHVNGGPISASFGHSSLSKKNKSSKTFQVVKRAASPVSCICQYAKGQLGSWLDLLVSIMMSSQLCRLLVKLSVACSYQNQTCLSKVSEHPETNSIELEGLAQVGSYASCLSLICRTIWSCFTHLLHSSLTPLHQLVILLTIWYPCITCFALSSQAGTKQGMVQTITSPCQLDMRIRHAYGRGNEKTNLDGNYQQVPDCTAFTFLMATVPSNVFVHIYIYTYIHYRYSLNLSLRSLTTTGSST